MAQNFMAIKDGQKITVQKFLTAKNLQRPLMVRFVALT